MSKIVVALLAGALAMDITVIAFAWWMGGAEGMARMVAHILNVTEVH